MTNFGARLLAAVLALAGSQWIGQGSDTNSSSTGAAAPNGRGGLYGASSGNILSDDYALATHAPNAPRRRVKQEPPACPDVSDRAAPAPSTR